MSAILSGITVTDEYLQRASRENPGWQFERSSAGLLIVTPTTSKNGPRNVELLTQLAAWNRATRFGKVFDSSSGFTMPDGAVCSPDGSCIRGDRWSALSDEEQDSYAPLCPDVCVEIESKTDSWAKLREKIDRYASYGAVYALAVSPTTRRTYIRGAPPLGLVLDIDVIIDA